MIKAIFYKEWIKIRWYGILAFILSIGFAGYAMLRVARICSLKGVDHLWIVMLQRDAIFVDFLQFVPLFAGLGLAIVQFVPEMYHKSFKLTLQLPVRATRSVAAMLGFGVMLLIAVFLPTLVVMWGYLQSVLAFELWTHIVWSTLPWYLAGIAAYLLTAWVTIEPTWRHRLTDGVVALLLLRVYFLAPTPEAYNGFLPLLTVVTLCYGLLTILSLTRFRDGRQD